MRPREVDGRAGPRCGVRWKIARFVDVLEVGRQGGRWCPAEVKECFQVDSRMLGSHRHEVLEVYM